MKVKDCMCNEVCWVKPNSTIKDCAKLMMDNHIGCVPVCDDSQKVVGVVTDRDIILRTVACDKDVKTTPVSDIMSCNVCCCTPNTDVNEAEKIMSQNQIRRIPVIDNNKIVGTTDFEISDIKNNSKFNIDVKLPSTLVINDNEESLLEYDKIEIYYTFAY